MSGVPEAVASRIGYAKLASPQGGEFFIAKPSIMLGRESSSDPADMVIGTGALTLGKGGRLLRRPTSIWAADLGIRTSRRAGRGPTRGQERGGGTLAPLGYHLS